MRGLDKNSDTPFGVKAMMVPCGDNLSASKLYSEVDMWPTGLALVSEFSRKSGCKNKPFLRPPFIPILEVYKLKRSEGSKWKCMLVVSS